MQIVTRQISGLGNQLFQYAAGRYYATRYGAGMSMSIDQPQNAVSHGYARPFLLAHFRIQAPVLPMSKLEQLFFSSRPLLKPAALAARQALRIQIVTEAIAQRFTFLEDLPIASRYACSLPRRLLADLPHRRKESKMRCGRSSAFARPAAGRTLEVLTRIQQQGQPVSLHMRRGDYTLAIEGNRTLPHRASTPAPSRICASGSPTSGLLHLLRRHRLRARAPTRRPRRRLRRPQRRSELRTKTCA